LLYLVGGEAESVSAYGDNRGTPVDIDSAIAIRFGKAVLGTITIVGDAPAWHEEITLMTDKIAFYIRDGKLIAQRYKGSKEPVELIQEPAVSPDQHFVDCILKGIPCESPIEAGLAVMKLTEAAWHSMANDGASVAIEPTRATATA
ncbi:MAG: hypothetical protein C4320_02320, partial [Armatimonadota bacterium]